MQREMCISLLLVALIGPHLRLDFFALASAASNEQGIEEVAKIWQELISGATLTPDQVFKHLEHIHQLYASFGHDDDGGYLSHEHRKQKKTYDNLFEAWNSTTPEQCTLNAFLGDSGLKRLREAHHPRNLNNYLEECMRRRIKFCEPILEDKITSELSQLNHFDKMNLNTLARCVAGDCYSPRRPLGRLDGVDFPAAILKYMKTLNSELSKNVFRGTKSDGKTPEERFRAIYREQVTELCSLCRDVAFDEMFVCDFIMEYDPKWKPPSPKILDWLHTHNMCENIHHNHYEPSAFELLRKKSSKQRIVGKLTGLVGGSK